MYVVYPDIESTDSISVYDVTYKSCNMDTTILLHMFILYSIIIILLHIYYCVAACLSYHCTFASPLRLLRRWIQLPLGHMMTLRRTLRQVVEALKHRKSKLFIVKTKYQISETKDRSSVSVLV